MHLACRVLALRGALARQTEELDILHGEQEEQKQRLTLAMHYMEAANRRFSELFAGLPVACFTFDAEGRIHEWNRACETLYGWSSKKAIDRTLFETICDEVNEPSVRAMIERVFAGEAINGMEFEWRRKDRSRCLVLSHTFPLFGSDNTVIGAISANIDITERKQAEQNIQHANELLEARVEERTTELARANLVMRREVQERQRAEEQVRNLNAQLKTRLERMTALRHLDNAITASMDLNFTLEVLLDQVLSQLGVDAARVRLFCPHTNQLDCRAGQGFTVERAVHAELRLGVGLAGKACVERTTRVWQQGEPSDAIENALHEAEGFVNHLAIPLLAKGRIQGVLELFDRQSRFRDTEWQDFLETLARQAAIAIESANLFDDLQRSHVGLVLAYDATIEDWSRALDLKDRETEGHTQRVTHLTIRLAQRMGVPPADRVHFWRGALLHDIGKMGVPDSILLKPGKLTEEEWKIMREHPTYSYQMLAPIDFLRPALDIPYCHHEKWDGTGYPRGLKGEEIPLAARIFAITDVWDALRNDRPYHRGKEAEEVLEYLEKASGSHFDPNVVHHFIAMLREDMVSPKAA
jgi:PAS domain S-box-containing protein/putative nucleotidyltransferase with HDIG domain